MHKNAVKKVGQRRKSGTAVNFELKIGTVPLRVGQLESMFLTHSNSLFLLLVHLYFNHFPPHFL